MLKIITKGNVLIEIETRFGLIGQFRFGSRTKAGGESQRPVVKRTGGCARHGGKSSGAHTKDRRVKLKQLHLKHGKCTKEKQLAVKQRAETGRKLRAEIKQIEARLLEQGMLESNWRKDWKL